MQLIRRSPDGKVEIPEDIWQQLGIYSGAPVDVSVEGDRLIIKRRQGNIQDAFGLLKARRSVTLEEMDEAIGRAVVEKFN